MNKIKVLLLLTTVLILTSIVLTFAPSPKWFETGTPSQTLTKTESDTLKATNKYIWSSELIWKEGRCYYFDLLITNETGYKVPEMPSNLSPSERLEFYNSIPKSEEWKDNRRELICTDKILSQTELETLQLQNVEWTLKQIVKSADATQTPTTYNTPKGENIKSGTVKDGLQLIN